MNENFSETLLFGGKSNSLGKAQQVVAIVLSDHTKLEELYMCLFDDDPWVRMRAVDSLEKICRVHPDWIVPFVDRFIDELHYHAQPSIQWHLAQIYNQVELTVSQRNDVSIWLQKLLITTDVDWIVSANAMTTLSSFVALGLYDKNEFTTLLKVQQKHPSKSVVRRASKILNSLL